MSNDGKSYTLIMAVVWNNIESSEDLEKIKKLSFENPQVIFKHSTRCIVSSMAKKGLDSDEQPENIPFYYLDLLKHRDISNEIADIFNVEHESPQALIIENGECKSFVNHGNISMDFIREAVQ